MGRGIGDNLPATDNADWVYNREWDGGNERIKTSETF